LKKKRRKVNKKKQIKEKTKTKTTILGKGEKRAGW